MEIAQRLVVLLINNFPSLLDLLICEITPKQELIKLSWVRERVLKSKHSKLGSLPNLLGSLFEVHDNGFD